MDLNKHIYEGWTVSDFINELSLQINMIMAGQSWKKPFQSKKELAEWCKSNQPHYKKSIPEVTSYFANEYGLN